jgi:hypothetical protein
MQRPRFAAIGFIIAAVLFIAVALAPLARGERMNPTFLALGVVFSCLAAVTMKKPRT